VLKAEGLTKRYGKRLAVDGLSLLVEPGHITGLLGPNGAGKSTTLSMIAGVTRPSAGRIEVSGFDLVSDGVKARACLGFVPQEIALYEHLTAKENLEYFARVQGVGRKQVETAVAAALELAQLVSRGHDRVKTFSGGMKRRLNIATALLHNPSVLILDEPTVGVDPQSRAHIFEQVRALSQNQGLAILYTSHYMEEIQALCDQIAIIDQGRLIAEGSASELVGRYARDHVEIELAQALGDPEKEIFLKRLQAHLGPCTSEGGLRYNVQSGASASAVAQAVEQAGQRLVALRAPERNLESVFLSLTGRGLRDS